MENRYKSYDPAQSLLFPPNIKEWLPEDHLAYFVGDVVDQLDHSQMEAAYEKDTRGQPSYNPRMMTKVFLYGYCTGSFSSRRIPVRRSMQRENRSWSQSLDRLNKVEDSGNFCSKPARAV
jgi:transposase